MKKLIPLILLLGIGTCSYAQQVNWYATLNDMAESEISCNAYDKDGNLYTAGVYNKDIPDILSQYKAGDVFVMKRNSSGDVLWTKFFPGASRIFKINFDHQQNLILSGAYLDTMIVEDDTLTHFDEHREVSVLIKLDASGNKSWTMVDSTIMQTHAAVAAICDKDNNIYSIGFDGDVSVYLKKVSAAGVLLWKKPFNNSVRTFSDITIDSGDRIYITGTAEPHATLDTFHITVPQTVGYASFLAALDTSGAVQKLVSKSYITFDLEQAIKVVGNYIFWYHDEDYNKVQLFNRQLDQIGEKNTGPSFITDYGFYPQNLSVLNDHQILITQKRWDTLFTFVIDTLLNIEESMMRVPNELRYTLHTAYNDHIILTAAFYSDSIKIKHLTIYNSLTSGHQPQIFWLGMSLDNTTGISSQTNHSCMVYPNPFSDKARFVLPSHAAAQTVSIELFDISGKKVKSLKVNADNAFIYKEDLSPGIYVYKAYCGKDVYTGKIIIR